jgi:hypothetical protein
MPNKHFYFAMGATNGVLVVYALREARHWLYRRTRWMRALYRWDRDWFSYFPIIIGAFGILALTPDIFQALHILPKEVTRGPIFNIFYAHSYFEWLEDESESMNYLMNSVGSIALFFIAIGIKIFYISEIKRIRKIEC